MSAPKPPITFELHVKEAFPETLALDDLADLLKAVQASVSGMARHQKSDLDEEVLGLALVEIGRGSAQLGFAAQEPQTARRAFAACSSAIRNDRVAELPPDVRKGIGDLVKVARTRKFTLHLVPKAGGDTDSKILPDTQMPSAETMDGDTVLYGVLERIGGAKTPKLMLRLDGTDKYLPCELKDRDQAKAFAPHLYEVIAVSGRATWNTLTWSIESFKVDSLLDYKRVTASEAFKVLAEACPDAWDGVEDVEAAIRELRG